METGAGQTVDIVQPNGGTSAIELIGCCRPLIQNWLEEVTEEADYAITVNPGAAFDFDARDGISPLLFDFELTIRHELLHGLGFSTLQPMDTTAPPLTRITLMDLLRLNHADTGNSLSCTELSTVPRAMQYGAFAVFFGAINQSNLFYPLADGPEPLGVGFSASHWFPSVDLVGNPPPTWIGLMDPLQERGQGPFFPGYYSPADYRALAGR
jgi:hypothetical protein